MATTCSCTPLAMPDGTAALLLVAVDPLARDILEAAGDMPDDRMTMSLLPDGADYVLGEGQCRCRRQRDCACVACGRDRRGPACPKSRRGCSGSRPPPATQRWLLYLEQATTPNIGDIRHEGRRRRRGDARAGSRRHARADAAARAGGPSRNRRCRRFPTNGSSRCRRRSPGGRCRRCSTGWSRMPRSTPRSRRPTRCSRDRLRSWMILHRR